MASWKIWRSRRSEFEDVRDFAKAIFWSVPLSPGRISPVIVDHLGIPWTQRYDANPALLSVYAQGDRGVAHMELHRYFSFEWVSFLLAYGACSLLLGQRETLLFSRIPADGAQGDVMRMTCELLMPTYYIEEAIGMYRKETLPSLQKYFRVPASIAELQVSSFLGYPVQW